MRNCSILASSILLYITHLDTADRERKTG